MLFRSYLLQEMVLLQEYARLRVTQRILKYICGEIIQRQKEKKHIKDASWKEQLLF